MIHTKAHCTWVLLNEIENLRLPQNDVARTIAEALQSEAEGIDTVDWDKVGTAAVTRWSLSGWKHLSARGRAIFEGRVKP